MRVLSLEVSPRDSHKSKQTKEWMASTKVSHLCGWGKSPIPWWNSQPLRIQLKLSTSTSSQTQERATQNLPNLWSLSSQDTGPVSSALLCLTLLILWCLFSTKEAATNQPWSKLKRSTVISASRDSGTVSWQESLWLVLLPVSNGGSTTHSR